MKLRMLCFTLLLAIAGFGQTNDEVFKNVPSLDALSGVWINADTLGIEPSLRNFKGNALLNRDMSSISWIASAPYSSGYHTGTLKINGEVPRAQLFRWYPYQSLRSTSTKTYSVNSCVKMLPDSNVFMWQIEIKNTTAQQQHYNIQQDLIGFISCYKNETWPWPYPFPTLKGKTNERTNELPNVRRNIGLQPSQFENITLDSALTPRVKSWPADDEILAAEKYHIIKNDGQLLMIADKETQCYAAYYVVDKPDKIKAENSGGIASWSVDLQPGATKTIRFIFSFSDDEQQLNNSISNISTSFSQISAGINLYWQKRWKVIFTPHNNLISGCFPTLQTTDTAVMRMYYNGPLTMLYMINTNLPQHKNVFLTGGPKWGATVVFFWDTAEWSNLFAMVEPEGMKEQIKSWISFRH